MQKSITSAFPILICLFLAGSLASCSKDADEVATTTPQLLVKAAWKLDAAGIDIDKDGEIDQHYEIEDCTSDNKLIFDTDGSGIFDAGTKLCRNEKDEQQSFDWNLKENNTIINLVVPDVIHGDAVIKTLNDKKFAIYQVLQVSAGVTVHQYLVLKH